MSKDKLIRLPVTPENLPPDLDPEISAELVSLSKQFITEKARLKPLEADKGIASRQIGQAKKENGPVDALMAQVKDLSQQIDSIKKTLQTLNDAAVALLNGETEKSASKTAPVLPGHFLQARTSSPITLMDIRVEVIGDTDAGAWDHYVNQHPNACAYHQYAFKRVIEKAFGHGTHYLAARSSQGTIVGVLPCVHLNSRIFGNYMVSVPFFNYGGALADNEDIEKALMQALAPIAETTGASHIEYRDTKPRTGMQQKTGKNSLVLALPEKAEILWQDIGTKVRAQIKKAESFDLEFRSGKAELLDDFYRVFSINMRDLGTPVYSKSFFATLLAQLDLNTTLCIVYRNRQPISCGFLLGYRNTLEIPWASTLRRANAWNANMFMYWHILKLAIERGFAFFDFGRSTRDAGTFKFKQQWGAQPQQLYWHYWLKDQAELPELNPDNPKFALAIAIWQRMPVWLTQIIGPHLVKNLP